MKLAAISLILFLLNTCGNAKTENRIELNREFRLKYNDTALLKPEKMKIRFSALIQDSRCPKEVQCITAGEAVIELELVKGKEKPNVMKLSTESVSNEFTYGKYKLKLIDVEPYPIAGEQKDPSRYIATLKISTL